MEQLFYPLDEPYKKKDQRKKQFIACRMELDLFKQLQAKAEQDNSDLSSVIRDCCRTALQVI